MIKKGIISFIFILLYTLCSAQIGNVIVERNFAKIYNENGYYTGKWINLTSNVNSIGWNDRYIVIVKNSKIYIYNHEGSYTGKWISLCSECKFHLVTRNNIIIIEKGYKLLHYDFIGSYTGKFTYF